jgi:hypothetical protein
VRAYPALENNCALLEQAGAELEIKFLTRYSTLKTFLTMKGELADASFHCDIPPIL